MVQRDDITLRRPGGPAELLPRHRGEPGEVHPDRLRGSSGPREVGPAISVAHRLIGAQNAQIGTALVLIGLELKPAQIGGYRTSSAAQCKLRRVTGDMVTPRRRSPTRARRADFSHLIMSPARFPVLRTDPVPGTGLCRWSVSWPGAGADRPGARECCLAAAGAGCRGLAGPSTL